MEKQHTYESNLKSPCRKEFNTQQPEIEGPLRGVYFSKDFFIEILVKFERHGQILNVTYIRIISETFQDDIYLDELNEIES